MIVGQRVRAGVKAFEQRIILIRLHQKAVCFPAGQCVQIRPDLQHPGLLPAVNRQRIGLLHFPDPPDVPVRQMVQDFNRRRVFQLFVNILQPQNRLMHRVLRRPDVLVLSEHREIFFRNGPHPFPAVQRLAPGQFIHDPLQFDLQRRMDSVLRQRCRCAQPVAQKMSAQLAAGCFPAPVHFHPVRIGNHLASLGNDPGFQIEILQQASGIQFHQIVFVQFHPFLEKARQHPDLLRIDLVQHIWFPPFPMIF